MTTKQHQQFKIFIERMKKELELNSDKGDWVNWGDQTEIWNELVYHFNKLDKVFDEGDIEKMRRQSAALANICLFFYNSTDLLSFTTRKEPSEVEPINYSKKITYEIQYDLSGKTVWIHSSEGNTVARLSTNRGTVIYNSICKVDTENIGDIYYDQRTQEERVDFFCDKVKELWDLNIDRSKIKISK